VSGEEQNVVERLTYDIEKLLPLGGWVKTLVVGGVCIGAWVTTIQVQARGAFESASEAKQQVFNLQNKFDDLIKAQAETNQRLARIEGRLESK
jgi:hypothetical protein